MVALNTARDSCACRGSRFAITPLLSSLSRVSHAPLSCLHSSQPHSSLDPALALTAAAVAHMRLSVRPCVWRDPAHLDLCLAPREIARAIGVQESSRHPSPHLLAHHLAGSIHVRHDPECRLRHPRSLFLSASWSRHSFDLSAPLHRASRTRPIWMSIIRGGASYVTNCVSRPAASRPLAACLTRVLCRPVADQSRAALPCFAVAFVMTCETPLSIVSRHLGCYAFFLCAARFRGTKLFYSSPSSASVLSQILPCAFLSHGSRFSNSFVAGGISA